MHTVDETGKIVSDEDARVTVEGALEDQDEAEKDDEGQKVIKVYIYKADPEEDELGEARLHPLRKETLFTSRFLYLIILNAPKTSDGNDVRMCLYINQSKLN